MIRSWNDAYTSSKLSMELVQKLYRSYKSRIKDDEAYIVSRPGIEVIISTSQGALDGVLVELGLLTIRIGDKFSSKHGVCTLLGVRNRTIWYSIENCEHANWWGKISVFSSIFKIYAFVGFGSLASLGICYWMLCSKRFLLQATLLMLMCWIPLLYRQRRVGMTTKTCRAIISVA